jgi:hypothetical protein
MTRFNKLKEMNLSGGTKVVLSAETGDEVVHYTGEDYESETVRKTGIANSLASLVTSKQLVSNTAIEELRIDGYLDDYERGSCEFEGYVASAITENWRELNLLEVETQHYDHKRGYTNIKAEVEITLSELLAADKTSPFLFSGWYVAVETPMGTLNVK